MGGSLRVFDLVLVAPRFLRRRARFAVARGDASDANREGQMGS